MEKQNKASTTTMFAQVLYFFNTLYKNHKDKKSLAKIFLPLIQKTQFIYSHQGIPNCEKTKRIGVDFNDSISKLSISTQASASTSGALEFVISGKFAVSNLLQVSCS